MTKGRKPLLPLEDSALVQLEQESTAKLKAEKDDLLKRLEIAQTVSQHLRSSYVSRITAQTANALALSTAMETVLGSIRDISSSYSEMLNAIQHVDRIALDFQESFIDQANRQKTITQQFRGVNESAQAVDVEH